MGYRFNKILNGKFGAKVFIYFSLLFVIASVLFISMFYHHQRRAMREKLLKTGEMLTEIFNENAALYVFSEMISDLEQSMLSIRNLNGVTRISVYKNSDGTLLKSLTNPDDLNDKPVRFDRKTLSSQFRDEISRTGFIVEEKQSCFLFWSPITLGISAPPEAIEVDARFDLPKEPATMETGSFSDTSSFAPRHPDRVEQSVIGYAMISISTSELKQQVNQLLRYIGFLGVIFVGAGSFIIILMIRSITTPLNRLTQSVRTLETRKPGTILEKVPVETDDEIGKLATAVNHMSETIQRREEALTSSEKRLRLLSSSLIDIRDTERKKLSQDLHDDLNQTLANLKMKVRGIGRQTYTDAPSLKKESEEAALEVDRIIESVRRISKDLSPSLLEDLGLSSGLRWLLNNFEHQHGISVISVVNDIDSLFPKEARINIFRLFQEALSNIRKHAEAENVSVVIKREPASVTFIISDDGVGFDADTAMARDAEDMGIGLINMNERARILGGDLEIKSNEGEGTFITLKVATPTSKEKNQWTLTA